MDLDNHISLRTFVKPNIIPLLKAISVALVVHVLFMLNWPDKTNLTVAEVPKWINVKLVAGFEEKDNRKKKSVNSKKEEEQKRIVKKNNKNISSVKKEKKVKKSNKETVSNATTFVVADSKPYKLENPKPVYPAAARRRGMQGTVLISIRVNDKGYVDSVAVEKTSGYKVLDRSALNSVAKWRFVPAKKENKFVASVVEIPVRFSLNDV